MLIKNNIDPCKTIRKRLVSNKEPLIELQNLTCNYKFM